MEFTCLWSKDAQQKKRKRWTDGVAHFSPATGLLSVWDQDSTVKISSTRLKPDEAVAALRDDVDEMRVGSISLQIIASVGPSAQQQDTPPLSTSCGDDPGDGHDDSEKAVARTVGPESSSSSAITTVVSRGSLNPASDQASGLEQAKRGIDSSPPSSALSSSNQLGATVSTDFAGRPASTHHKGRGGGVGGSGIVFGPGLKRRAFKPLVSGLGQRTRDGLMDRPDASPSSSTDGNEGVNALDKDDFSRRNEIGGGVRGVARVGLVGGASGARRFHAPRSTVVTAATQKLGLRAPTPQTESGGRPTAVADVKEGELSRVAVASATGTSDAVANPEDLVLEWTTGDPPQPIKAGGSLTRRLHPHQRDGLKVLWKCLAGRGGYDGRGAILADEMGLGKTATAIALCTCVLRHRRAECRKAVVVCPSSLVKNWANEFRKWCPLGGGAVAVDQAGAVAAQMVADFKIGAPARYPILVISYELYRNHGSVINATEGLGLLIADEGHRLKNSSETKTAKALKACPAAMRLVMTGTPMQNDLDEFFAMSDFVNPGLLGSLKSFRSRYTRPIKAAWDREAVEDVKEMATERTRELGKLTGKFVLRRTKDVIRGTLPPALEIVVFCRPSQRQLSLYKRCIAGSSVTASLFGDGGAADASATPQQVSFRDVLPLISTLRRLCNHPDLVKTSDGGGETKSLDDDYLREKLPDHIGNDSDDDLAFLLMDQGEEKVRGRAESRRKENTLANELGSGHDLGPARSWKVPRLIETEVETGKEAVFGAGMSSKKVPESSSGFAQGEEAAAAARYETEDSGKLLALEALLRSIRQEFPGDKVVVTSNFTSALDVLVCLAERNSWGFQRLDGGTASNARQPLVDRFNKAPAGALFLFFLSARAGGVGLNLIGANRIVLYDSDWNPATDDQAMARVWRLGQTKEVSMYRLVSTGTLEETIFQRQIFKGALYGLIHDSNQSSSSPIIPASLDSGDRGQGGGGERANNRVGTGPKEGRGFSQEELKELFVLKTGTASDTYDKLRRRHPLVQRGNNISERSSSLEHDHDGAESSAEGWKDYKTPSDVADLALRRALEGQAATVGNVVTFVREVKRGGVVEPAAVRREAVGRRGRGRDRQLSGGGQRDTFT